MTIDGLHIEKDGSQMVVFVERFSKELQDLIRNQLAGIFHGFSEVDDLPDFYSYPQTLQSFLDRYNTKSDKTQKGMIGELLAHVLIGALFKKLDCLSVFKNKEERSIKKGFDIIYYHKTSKDLWYTEVKSGSSSNKKVQSDAYNLKLLKRSRDGILEMFESKRNELWQSAIIDVMLVVEHAKRKKMKELLSKDAPDEKKGDKERNVILVSVLYHKLTERMTMQEIVAYHNSIVKEKIFENAVLFCIQKATYDKVAKFLLVESKK
jgi:hypothetical protein